MTITKTKEVTTEEIEVSPGTYYFECHEGSYHKIVLTEYDEDGLEYFLESVEPYASPYGIRVRQDTIFDEEEFPYKFSAFIREISSKKIEKEEFEQQKQEVLNKLLNGNK